MPTRITMTPTTIDRSQITIDHTFRHRSGTDSESHLKALRKTLRNTGRLDPIIVWQEVDNEGTLPKRHVLLDGHYRYAAYRAEQHAGKIQGRGIPAMLLKGDRMEAHLVALKANSKDVLSLSLIERTDAAWKLVQTYPTELSKRRLSEASGVSERTVARMRQQLRKFREAKESPSGSWMTDRRFPEVNDFEPPSDEARRQMVAALTKALQSALNEVRTKDVEIIGDAVHDALGPRQFAAITDYLRAEDEDGDTVWMVQDEFEADLPEDNIPPPF